MRERMRHTQHGRTLRAPARTATGLSGLLTSALLIATLPGLTLSNASWVDPEWASGTLTGDPGVGTLDCDADGIFTTDARGRYLQGSLLGTNLDTIVALDGVHTTNDSTTSTAEPVTATSLGDDAYANPLSLTALSTINLQLTGLLQLPLTADTGVYNQYAQAHSNGESTGAAGLVNDSGGIALTAQPPGPHVPRSATLHLGTLLENALGSDLSTLVTNLTDLQLGVGAVAASATLDACNALWSGDLYSNLDRQYGIAGLDLDIDSPLVADLVTTVTAATTTIESAVNALSTDGDLLSGIGGALTGVLGPLLGALGLGTPLTTLGLTLDLAAVNDLLDDTISDSNGIVEIDLDNGTINIDIAHLVDSVNGLNNQAPNTQLLLNDTIINALTAAVTSALAEWVTDILDAIDAALDAATVDLDISLPVGEGLTALGTITVSVDASLAAMLDGTAEVNAGFAPDGLVCILLPVACATVNAAVTALTTTSEDALLLALADVIDPAITAATSTLISTLETNLQAITAPLVTLLADTLDFLFGEDRVLSILINAQNAPEPPNTNPEPGWAPGMAPPVANPYDSGQYGVSALRLDVLGALAGLEVEIDLAHAVVGSNKHAP